MLKYTLAGGTFGGLLTLLMVQCQSKKPEVIEPVKPVTEFECVNRKWKDRGVMPIGFAKGMAEAYKAALARGEVGRPIGDPEKDALAYYGIKPGNELRKTYAMLIGLAMRESNGNYTLGRDYTAKGEQSSLSAETGAWQFSMDAIKRDPRLAEIYEMSKAPTYNCMNNTFKEGLCDPSIASCPSKILSIRTDGYIGQPPAGLAFQKHFRGCAAAQVEYAAVMIRAVRSHFGPLNRKELEYVTACEDWLASLEEIK